MGRKKSAAATAVIATLLGIFGAKAVTRYRIPGQKPVIGVIMLPMVIPVSSNWKICADNVIRFLGK